MPMRWVLVWKNVQEDGHASVKAKARLVVKGLTDPDLTTLRAEAPTLSKAARHMLLQLGVSLKFTFKVGDVKTAFLQGDKSEKDRKRLLGTHFRNTTTMHDDRSTSPEAYGFSIWFTYGTAQLVSTCEA